MKNLLFVKIGAQREQEEKDRIVKSFVDIEKSYVKSHIRTSKTGNQFNVKNYHRVSVSYSDPNNQMVTKRNEKQFSIRKVNAESEEEAKNKLERYYKKSGYKVHEVNYLGKEPEKSANDPIEQNRLKSEKFVKNMPEAIRNVFDIHYKKSNDNDLEIKLFEDITKSHIRQHTRMTKYGKMVNVKEHEDKRRIPQEKDFQRIEDIAEKGKGNKAEMLKFSRRMAHLITDPDKAHRRALACEENNYHDCAAVFFQRERELKRNNSNEQSVGSAKYAIGDVKSGAGNVENKKEEQKEKNIQKKDYNFLLDSWNSIIEKNQNIIDALKTFSKENNLSEEETKDFFNDRQKNKGKKVI